MNEQAGPSSVQQEAGPSLGDLYNEVVQQGEPQTRSSRPQAAPNSRQRFISPAMLQKVRERAWACMAACGQACTAACGLPPWSPQILGRCCCCFYVASATLPA